MQPTHATKSNLTFGIFDVCVYDKSTVPMIFTRMSAAMPNIIWLHVLCIQWKYQGLLFVIEHFFKRINVWLHIWAIILQ